MAEDMSIEIDYPNEYDNSGRVANAAQLLDAYVEDAANFRKREDLVADYNLAYGPAERNQMDIFWPDEDRESPIVMFIHGGYWKSMDRSAFSHMAGGLLQRGIAVAMPSYTLCPDIQISGIINELRRASLVLYQTYKRKVVVVGHSAGGHLAACMMATDWENIHHDLPEDLVAAGMGISGIYDLLPILHTPVNETVQMDVDQASAASPIDWLPEAVQKFEAWVGADESAEYHRQSRDLSERWSMSGTPTKFMSVENENHFTIIHALTDSDSAMVQKISELVEEPAAKVKLPRLSKKKVLAEMQTFDMSPPDGEMPKATKAKSKGKKVKKAPKASSAKPKAKARATSIKPRSALKRKAAAASRKTPRKKRIRKSAST